MKGKKEEIEEELIPQWNLNRTIDDLVQEFGVSICLVIRRRVWHHSFIDNFDIIALSRYEIELIFR